MTDEAFRKQVVQFFTKTFWEYFTCCFEWTEDTVIARTILSTQVGEDGNPDEDAAMDRFYLFRRVFEGEPEYDRLVSITEKALRLIRGLAFCGGRRYNRGNRIYRTNWEGIGCLKTVQLW